MEPHDDNQFQDETIESEEEGYYGLAEFLRDLILDPKYAFREHFGFITANDKYFGIVFVIYGIGYGIDKIDSRITRADLTGNYESLAFLNEWTIYWPLAILGGMLGGYIGYLILGWFYDVRVKWAKGTSNIDLSRKLYLYSGFWFWSSVVVFTFIGSLIFDQPYSLSEELHLFDIITGLLYFVLLFHSIYISYIGVTHTTDVEAWPARIWFLIVPIIFYLVLFNGIILFSILYFIG